MELSVVPYEENKDGGGGGGGGGGKYKECMRNHAAEIGRQAYDGCGEFMPAGELGTLEAFKCAACGCHRNFHRREDNNYLSVHHRHPHAAAAFFLPPPPTPPQLLLPAPVPYRQLPPPLLPQKQFTRDGSETPPPLGPTAEVDQQKYQYQYQQQQKKRYRTKFTSEQKDKMLAFAERVGWRIQRHDDGELETFCGEVGIKRHVLKVWMHNNKHAHHSNNNDDAPHINGNHSSSPIAPQQNSISAGENLPESGASPAPIHA